MLQNFHPLKKMVLPLNEDFLLKGRKRTISTPYQRRAVSLKIQSLHCWFVFLFHLLESYFCRPSQKNKPFEKNLLKNWTHLKKKICHPLSKKEALVVPCRCQYTVTNTKYTPPNTNYTVVSKQEALVVPCRWWWCWWW